MKKLYSNTYLMRFLTAQLPSLALFIMILSNQVLRKPVKLASSQNVKNQLQYSIYNTSWFTPWGVFLLIFSKIHTTFHTKFTPLLFKIAVGNFANSHWNDI